MQLTKRRVLSGITALALAAGLASAVAPAATAAVSPTAAVVINEVYGGGGSTGTIAYDRDFVELYNTTSSPVDLTGWSVQYGSGAAGNYNWSGIMALSGSIPAHGYYLVGAQGGTGTPAATIPTPDADYSVAMSATSGKIALANQATAITCATKAACEGLASVIDLVGYGTSTDVYAGAGRAPAPSTSTSISRDASHTNTASNSADFTTINPPTPKNSSMSDSTALALAGPTNLTATAGTAWVGTFTASGGTAPYTYDYTSMPSGGVLNIGTGVVSWTNPTVGSHTITVQVTDSAATPATATATVTLVVSAGGPTITDIRDIQGDYATYSGQSVTVKAVVTASYPYGATGVTTSSLRGITVQQAGTGGATWLSDAANTASAGIFVYLPSGLAATSYPQVGDTVQVTGTVGKYNSALVQLSVTNTADVTNLGNTGDTVTPITDTPWPATQADRLRMASMLYLPTADYTVTGHYEANYYGLIDLAYGTSSVTGSDVLRIPTDVCAFADSPCMASINADNAARAVTLDDGSAMNFNSNKNYPLPYLEATDTHARIGEAVSFQSPVIVEYRNYSYSSYKAPWVFQPTSLVAGESWTSGPAVFTDNRTTGFDDAAIATNGTPNVTVASFNVLNFFPTYGTKWVSLGGGCTYYTDKDGVQSGTVNSCTNLGPRGAANEAAFTRQLAKEVKAIQANNADVIGLMEMENSEGLYTNGGAYPLASDPYLGPRTLVEALNADAGYAKWDYVRTVTGVQSDAIQQAIIYQPAHVTLVGAAKVLDSGDPGWGAFSNARKPIGQAFKATNGYGAPFFVSVNHFKSKGSCSIPGDGDSGQGACNGSRTAQSNALTAWISKRLTTDADLAGVASAVIIGDLNAYSFEDPILALEAAGYTDVDKFTGGLKQSYAYTGADGLQELGSLDHILVNAHALARFTGSDLWNINSVESIALEYSRYNYNAKMLYAETPYRSSDHDPVKFGMDAVTAPVITDPTDVTVVRGSDALFSVTVTAGLPTPTLQWQQSTDGGTTWTDIAGATATSYTVSAATLAQSGTMVRVKVANSVDTVYSQSATLTVVAPLAITAPGAGTAAPGESWLGTFAATGGVGPYTFSLLVPPSGVSIDPSTGEVTFAVPTSVSGNVTVRVQVTDKDGRTASASVTIAIKLPDTGSTCAPLDTPLFRFYKSDGTHFFTASASEANTVKGYAEYKYEGIAGYIGAPNATPCADQTALYRFYKSDGTHFYTASAYEADLVKTFPQYTYEGVVGVVDTARSATTAPVYRFYKFAAGTHFYTASDYERGLVMAYPEYRYEGISFYMRPPQS